MMVQGLNLSQIFGQPFEYFLLPVWFGSTSFHNFLFGIPHSLHLLSPEWKGNDVPEVRGQGRGAVSRFERVLGLSETSGLLGTTSTTGVTNTECLGRFERGFERSFGSGYRSLWDIGVLGKSRSALHYRSRQVGRGTPALSWSG